MPKLFLSILLAVTLLFPNIALARYTPNDLYQEKRTGFEAQLNSIQDPAKKAQIEKLDQGIYDVNNKIADRFNQDALRLAAIMDEVKRRQGIKETRVAYGNVNTPIEQADYWVNFAAEAVAYQKIQDYTPYGISETNISGPVQSSINRMKSDYSVLRDKIFRAKTEVGKVLKASE
jgi:hypothetical protein